MRWVRSPCRSNVDVDFVVRSVTGTIVSSRKLPLIWSACYTCEKPSYRAQQPQPSTTHKVLLAFSLNGDAALGIRLTVAMVPLWMQLSLIEECCMRIERAVTVPDKTNQSTRR
jgi:hypothetical protein